MTHFNLSTYKSGAVNNCNFLQVCYESLYSFSLFSFTIRHGEIFLFVCFSFPFNAFAATQCFDAHSSSCDKMGGRDHFNVEKGTHSHYIPSSWSLAVAHL